MHFTQAGMHDAYRALAKRVRVDLDFLALTPIATIVCTFGFKMNSASVIIGAMVLSPLLYSVICVGAAAQQRDWTTLMHAVRTFSVGLAMAIATAAVTSLLFASTDRSEITTRLASEPLDYLIVAFFSGMAALTPTSPQNYMKRSWVSPYPWRCFPQSSCWQLVLRGWTVAS